MTKFPLKNRRNLTLDKVALGIHLLLVSVPQVRPTHRCLRSALAGNDFPLLSDQNWLFLPNPIVYLVICVNIAVFFPDILLLWIFPYQIARLLGLFSRGILTDGCGGSRLSGVGLVSGQGSGALSVLLEGVHL